MAEEEKKQETPRDSLPDEEAAKEAPVQAENKTADLKDTAPPEGKRGSVFSKLWKPRDKKAKAAKDAGEKGPDADAPTKRKAPRRESRFFRIGKRVLKAAAIMVGLLLVMALAATAFVVLSQSAVSDDFQITFYQVTSDKINTPFRIALLSDLHNTVYGNRNKPLINEIKRLEPDLIVMAGDMINSYEVDYQVTTDLIRALHEEDIAPIYFGYGNHDLNYYLNTSKEVETVLGEAGAIMLRDKYETINVNGNTVTIGGLASSRRIYKEYNSPRFIKRFEETDGYRILICHQPDFFLSYFSADTPLDADMALCGHAHGGQVRIPGIGALYAPDQGFRPKLTEGVHTIGECKVVISRGLGGRKWQIRINNKPELVIIDVE
ncbi:MAG: metallophosphoesterase [Clostridia bacterium]|nr:metallophosphoesterase [Clostridia bacterium]